MVKKIFVSLAIILSIIGSITIYQTIKGVGVIRVLIYICATSLYECLHCEKYIIYNNYLHFGTFGDIMIKKSKKPKLFIFLFLKFFLLDSFSFFPYGRRTSQKETLDSKCG